MFQDNSVWFIVRTTCRLSPSQANTRYIVQKERIGPLVITTCKVVKNKWLLEERRAALGWNMVSRALPTNAIYQRLAQASRKVFCNSQFCGTVTPARCLQWEMTRVHVMLWHLHMLLLQNAVTNIKHITPGDVIGPVIECFSHIRINCNISYKTILTPLHYTQYLHPPTPCPLVIISNPTCLGHRVRIKLLPFPTHFQLSNNNLTPHMPLR